MDNYQKKFDEWTEVKKEIQRTAKYDLCKEGAVFWASVGVNIGVEQDGKGPKFTRPVLILKQYGDKMALIAPTTSQVRYGKYHYNIMVDGVKVTLLLNQLRTIDLSRLHSYIDEIPEAQLIKIRSRIADLISETFHH